MLKISVVIPTRDRPKDLAELLSTLLDQSYLPYEVVTVDDSVSGSAKEIIGFFAPRFKSIGCTFQYVKGSSDGIPAARNLGAEIAQGDVFLFLDDDVLLGRNVLRVLAIFLMDHPEALGIQPMILETGVDTLAKKLKNAIRKPLMLSYLRKNRFAVRRSATNVFPYPLTEVVRAQRLSGCCCYRRDVFKEMRFDTNLKRWGYMEDLDLSHRIYKKKPNSLYAIPSALIIHKASAKARLPTRLRIYMKTIYWFYIFFKDVFNGSLLNIIAFLWALIGNLIATVWEVIAAKKDQKHLFYLIESYLIAFKNLRSILIRDLEFFNKNLLDAE